MDQDCFRHAKMHALYRILNTPARPWPHGHLFVEDVFPAGFYGDLHHNLPPSAAYTPLAQTGKVAKGDYDMRTGFLLDDAHLSRISGDGAAFWTGLFQHVLDDDFANALISRHQPQLRERAEQQGVAMPERFKRDMILVRDGSSDGVKVHTSDQRNWMTLLFYLPADASQADHGTTLYRPKAPDFRCPGGVHHDFADFDAVHTLPFLPNSLYMFVKSFDTFHGVKPIHQPGARRDLLLFYLHE